jgi:hypothetical protein
MTTLIKIFAVKLGEIKKLETEVNDFLKEKDLRKEYEQEIYFLDREIVLVLDY